MPAPTTQAAAAPHWPSTARSVLPPRAGSGTGSTKPISQRATLMSSPGGDLNQAIIIGEIIRSRGLVTAVGVADPSGHIRPSYCASACVLAFAGGTTRVGVEGSMLGVHRFVALAPGPDPVAETQRTAGMVLNYLTRMGVSSSVVEAMSATSDVRWLGAREAAAMSLVTDSAGRP